MLVMVRLSTRCCISTMKILLPLLVVLYAPTLPVSSFRITKPNGFHQSFVSKTILLQQTTTTTTTESLSLPPVVDDLLLQAGIPKDRVLSCEAMENVKGAYCNQVLRLTVLDDDRDTSTKTATTLIAKIFSTLAQKRMLSVQDCLEFHRTAGESNLGPEVAAAVLSNDNNDDDNSSSSAGVLMKAFVGRTLTDHDLHGSDVAQCAATRNLLQATAAALARLHSMGTVVSDDDNDDDNNDRNDDDSDKNVLIHACEVMLSLCDSEWRLSSSQWSLEQLCQTFNDQKLRLQKTLTDDNGGTVKTGHGDFKPSNIMLVDVSQQSTTRSSATSVGNEIRFVDWDLTGPNYRVYDLAKLFRTTQPTKYTCRNRRYFLESYAAAYNKDSPAHEPLLSFDTLEAQIQLILPTAWLEAAIFFACMASNTVDSGNVSRWNKLAFDRLECYRASLVEA